MMRKLLVWMLAATTFGLGCDRTKQLVEQRESSEQGASGSARLVSQSISPKTTLQECLAAYKRIDSYEDQAYVSLKYRLNGVPQQDRAPLSVAWQREGKVGFSVYSVHAGPSEDRWRLRIDRDDMAETNQVLSRGIPKQVDFQWLLADPLVSQSMSAGLAGFPPQFDLLLSEQPLQRLFDSMTAVSFDSPVTIEGQTCHVLNLTRGELTYQLCIDKASMLLRKLVLPNNNLPSEIRSNSSVSNFELAIEFEGIRTNQPIDWTRFAVEVKPDDVLVSQFVSKPYIRDTRMLGIRVPAFEIKGPAGDLAYRSFSRPDVRATVLIWLADHPACRAAADQFVASWSTLQQDPQLANAVEFVPIWAEPEAPEGQSFAALQSEWRLPGSLALDRDALGRDLFQVQEAPSVVILDQDNRVQVFESGTNPKLHEQLPEYVRAVCAGEDVATELKSIAQAQQRRYRSDLHRLRAIERSNSKDALPSASYAPERFQLEERSSAAFLRKALAADFVGDQHLWTLHDDGAVTVRELSNIESLVLQSWKTGWKLAPEGRLLVDRSERFLAYCVPSQQRVEIFDTRQKRNQRFELQVSSPPMEFTWLDTQEADNPRLATFTRSQELIVLDPQSQEQLRGRCPAGPIAFLKQGGLGVIRGQVVLSNGEIESLQLEREATARPRSPLTKRAAYNNAEGLPSPARKLSFPPALGPWLSWNEEGSSRLVLASGWLAEDEPALFLLNAQFHPLWHYRMPLEDSDAKRSNGGVSRDPATGLAVWATADSQQRIYLLREDGLADHFRVRQTPLEVSLHRLGSELHLDVVFEDRIDQQAIVWP